jgi:hypothetical protein
VPQVACLLTLQAEGTIHSGAMSSIGSVKLML